MTDQEYHAARTAVLEALLSSTARLKLIVAGPGTGKTFTFQELLRRTNGPALAMTFLLVLVRDLEGKFNDNVEVYSFHGFARKLLHRIPLGGVSSSVHYYPPLATIMVEDIRVVDGALMDELQLGALYRNLVEDGPFLHRALESGTYYDAVAHDDAVYRVLRALEGNLDLVPVYAQLVVDEYQDFCPMEVAFIGRLSEKSPTLIVGDDDQALYAFRDASPDAIRQLAAGQVYERFELPYCTRCTEILVQAAHTVVRRAQTIGLLRGRVEKPYECFLPEKREESARYPTIRHAHCSVQTKRCPYMCLYIEQQIRRIPAGEIAESHAKNFPTVLLIGPNPFLSTVEAHLRTCFSQVQTPPKTDPALDVLDAYRLLLRNENSNLGWRILLQVLRPTGWEQAVQQALGSGNPLRSFLHVDFIAEQLGVAALLRKWRSETPLSNPEAAALATALAVQRANLSLRIDGPEAEPEPTVDQTAPTIMLTSLMGSKGLQAGHVFIVGVNELHFPHSNRSPSNEEVCQTLGCVDAGQEELHSSVYRAIGSRDAKAVNIRGLAEAAPGSDRVD